MASQTPPPPLRRKLKHDIVFSIVRTKTKLQKSKVLQSTGLQVYHEKITQNKTQKKTGQKPE